MVPESLVAGFQGRGLLPFFLLFLPVLILNLGEHFRSLRDQARMKAERERKAESLLETQVHRSSVPWIMGKIAREYQDRWSRQTDPTFQPPPPRDVFSGRQWWAFTLEKGSKGPWKTALSPAGAANSRAFAKVLESLAGWADGKKVDEKAASKLVDYLFGPDLSLSLLCQLQNEPVRVIYLNRHYFLYWSRFPLPGKKEGGLFYLVPDSAKTQDQCLVLSSKSCSSKEDTSKVSQTPDRLAGFLDLAPDGAAHVLPPLLKMNPEFSGWMKGWKTRCKAIDAGTSPPWSEDLGRWELYARLIPGGSHLAFLVMSKQRGDSAFSGLPLLNAGALLGMLILLILGSGWGPPIRLRWRFAGLYLGVVVCALALFSVVAGFYLEELSGSLGHQARQELDQALNRYDEVVEKVQRRFQMAFQTMKSLPALLKSLEEKNLEKSAAMVQMQKFCYQQSPPLRYSFLEIVDPVGGYQATFSTAVHPKEIEGFIEFHEAGMRHVLRGKIEQMTGVASSAWKTSDKDMAIRTAFESAGNQPFAFIFLKYINVPTAIRYGKKQLWRIWDVITTGEGKWFGLLVSWQVKDFDRMIAREAFRIWRKQYPQIGFAIFRSENQKLSRLAGKRRDARALEGIARQAGNLGGPTRLIPDDLSFLKACRPSDKNPDIWLSGWYHTGAIQDTLDNQRRLVGGLVLLGLLTVILLTYLSEQRLVVPLLSLAGELREVRAGNLETRLESKRGDEIGTLFSSFAGMIEGLRARRRLAALVSGPSLEMVCEGLEGLPPDQGKEVEIIALVSDIRSFTTLCENHAPRDITSLLNRHFDRVSQIIGSCGGSVDRFIGDAVQGVFLCRPGERATVSLKAFEAATGILRETESMNEERRASGLFEYRCGIGLAHGTAWVACLGDRSRRMDICFLGPAFDTSAHLEALSKKNPAFPVVFDARIKEDLHHAGRSGARPVGEDDLEGWVFSDIPSNPRKETPPASDGREPPPVGAKKEPSRDRFLPAASFPGKLGLLWMAGLLFLYGPFSLLWNGMAGADAKDLQWRRSEASSQNRRMLAALKRQTLEKEFLEGRLEQIAMNVADDPRKGLPCSDPRFGALMKERVLDELGALGVKPQAVLYSPSPGGFPGGLQAPFDEWAHISETVSPVFPRRDLFANLRRLLSLYEIHVFAHLPLEREEMPRIRKGISAFVVSYLRGKMIQAEIASESCLVYWQPLISSRDLDRVGKEMGRYQPWIDHALRYSGFPLPLVQRYVPGGMLIVLPRGQMEKSHLESVFPMMKRGQSVGAFLPGDGDRPLIHSPGFGEFWKEYASQGTAPGNWGDAGGKSALLKVPGTCGDWVVQTEILEQPDPGQLLVASKTLPEGWENTLRNGLFRPGIFILGLAMAFFWSWGVFRERGLARTLSGQFLAGTGAAVFLPLVGILFLLNHLSSDWERNLVSAMRDRFFREMTDLESRTEFQVKKKQEFFPVLWKKYDLESLLERNAAEPATASTRTLEAIDNALSRIAVEATRPPCSVTLSSLILSRPGGWVHKAMYIGKVATEASPLEQATAHHTEKVMQRLFPELWVDKAGESPREALQKEMATEFILRVLGTSFGPLGIVRLLYGQGRLNELRFATQVQCIAQFFCPREGLPRAFMQFSYNDFSARHFSISRLLGDQFLRFAGKSGLDAPRLFLMETEHPGVPLLPEDGERFTFLRKIGREAADTGESFSHWIEADGGSYFVDVLQGVQTKQFLYLGVIPRYLIFEACHWQRVGMYLLLTGFVLFLLFLSWRSARTLVEPVLQIASGLDRLAGGNLAGRLPEDRADELGDLAKSFNLMVKGLQERELLSRLVSTSARATSGNDAVERQAVEGERRLATIMYFAVPKAGAGGVLEGIGRNHSPLDFWLKEIFEDVLANGGDIDKILGDKVLAVFYHPSGKTGAMGANRDIHFKVCTIARNLIQKRQEGRLSLPVRIGINTGEVIAGFMGSEHRRDHTIIGDAVNLAARCCAVADQADNGPVVVTARVIEGLTPRIRCAPLAVTSVKGKQEAVTLFRLEP